LEGSNEDKQVIPAKYSDEIDSIFEEDKSALEKMKKGLKAESMKESIKEIPDELNEKIVSGFSEFIQNLIKVTLSSILKALFLNG